MSTFALDPGLFDDLDRLALARDLDAAAGLSPALAGLAAAAGHEGPLVWECTAAERAGVGEALPGREERMTAMPNHITVTGEPAPPAPDLQHDRDQAAASAEAQAAAVRRERALREDYLRHRMGLAAGEIAAVLGSDRAALVPLGSNDRGQVPSRADLGL